MTLLSLAPGVSRAYESARKTWARAARRRPSNIIDRWDGRMYRRAIVIEGYPVELGVVQLRGVENPTLLVTAHGERLPP
jgi:hypothetical protein